MSPGQLLSSLCKYGESHQILVYSVDRGIPVDNRILHVRGSGRRRWFEDSGTATFAAAAGGFTAVRVDVVAENTASAKSKQMMIEDCILGQGE